MSSLFHRLSRVVPQARRPAVPRRLSLETLEAREVPAVINPDVLLFKANVSYDAAKHTVTVSGSNLSDKVNVTLIDIVNPGTVDPADLIVVSVQSPLLSPLYKPLTLPLNAVSKINVYLNAGNDTYTCDPRIPIATFVDGGLGNDTIKTGAGNDVLIGGYGNDYLCGRGGDDVLCGDLSFLSKADPKLVGGDTLDAGTGKNTLYFGGGYADNYITNTGGIDKLLDNPDCWNGCIK